MIKVGEESCVYTTQQLAEKLDVTTDAVQRYARIGKIPGQLHFGRIKYFSRKKVDQWLDGEND